MQRIEAVASSALRRWDQLADDTSAADTAAVAPAALVPA
jgi:hypothetical protein